MSGYCSSLTPCMFTDGWYPRGAFSVRFLDANPATRRPCRQCECQRATLSGGAMHFPGRLGAGAAS